MNECEVYRLDRGGKLCLHECVNVPGSYRCSCPSGYKLLADGRSCEGEWQDGVEDKSSFAGFRMVGLPCYLLAERNSCDCESGSFTSRGEREAVVFLTKSYTLNFVIRSRLAWVDLPSRQCSDSHLWWTEFPLKGGWGLPDRLERVSSSAIWELQPLCVERSQLRWFRVLGEVASQMSYWEELEGMSSRVETLRQTQDKLEVLYLPSSPGTPLYLRMLPPWPRPG